MPAKTDGLEFSIARLHLEPNDVLVVKFSKPATADAVERARSVLHKATEHKHILFIEPEIDLSVLTRAEIEQRTS